jgi:Uma2 family endonuclease
MASTLATTIEPDTVLSFDINPGTLPLLLESRTEKGPRLKCFEGSVTLVSPGMPHEAMGFRLNLLILAVCFGLRIKFIGVASTTWTLPPGSGDTAYEADEAYYIGNIGRAKDGHPPDLAVEVVVSHPAEKALRAGALLKIPEIWVLDVPRNRLTFHHLATRGPHAGTYRPKPRSRAFPFLTSAEVLQRLDEPEADAATFHEDCREWARHVLAPRLRAD